MGGAGRVSGRTASGRRADPEVDTGVRQEVMGWKSEGGTGYGRVQRQPGDLDVAVSSF